MTDEYQEIREQIQKLCAQYPGEYWRDLDTKREYPTAFVKALTEAGYLSVLIPEEFGGSGLGITAAAVIMEEIQKAGCNGGACHAQMYTMGTILRHGTDEQKQKYLPGIAAGDLRMQAFGVTEPTSGTDTLSSAHHGGEERCRRLCRQRPENLDVAGRTFGPDAAACAHPVQGRGRKAHRRACRCSSSISAKRSATGWRSNRSAR